jgi:hypothetical protein
MSASEIAADRVDRAEGCVTVAITARLLRVARRTRHKARRYSGFAGSRARRQADAQLQVALSVLRLSQISPMI